MTPATQASASSRVPNALNRAPFTSQFFRIPAKLVTTFPPSAAFRINFPCHSAKFIFHFTEELLKPSPYFVDSFCLLFSSGSLSANGLHEVLSEIRRRFFRAFRIPSALSSCRGQPHRHAGDNGRRIPLHSANPRIIARDDGATCLACRQCAPRPGVQRRIFRIHTLLLHSQQFAATELGI